MTKYTPFALSLAVAIAISGSSTAEENWPQWRGPHGNGIALGSHLPTKWSDTENVLWKIDVPAYASSTPVIWGDKLFLISPEAGEKIELTQIPAGGNQPATARGGRGGVPGIRLPGERVGANPGGGGIYLWCVDKNTGKALWQKRFSDGNHQVRKGNMANPSPVVDEERVYVIAGTGTLTAFDHQGNELWQRDIQTETSKFGQNHGYSASPLLYKDRLILAVLHGARTDEPSYMLAINKATGEPIWKTVRPTNARAESPDSYATPQLLERGDKAEVIINGGDVVTGHDPMSGQEVWRVDGLNPKNNPSFRIVPSVTIAPGGLIFVPTREQPLLALDSNERDSEGRPKVLWQSEWGPDVASPVSDGKFLWLYAKDNLGVIVCHDARTGQPLYERQRLEAGGYHSSSLLLADGKIYATNENAETTVLEASPEFKVLARNTLDSAYTIASMAASGNRLYIRTADHLYCIGEM